MLRKTQLLYALSGLAIVALLGVTLYRRYAPSPPSMEAPPSIRVLEETQPPVQPPVQPQPQPKPQPASIIKSANTTTLIALRGDKLGYESSGESHLVELIWPYPPQNVKEIQVSYDTAGTVLEFVILTRRQDECVDIGDIVFRYQTAYDGPENLPQTDPADAGRMITRKVLNANSSSSAFAPSKRPITRFRLWMQVTGDLDKFLDGLKVTYLDTDNVAFALPVKAVIPVFDRRMQHNDFVTECENHCAWRK